MYLYTRFTSLIALLSLMVGLELAGAEMITRDKAIEQALERNPEIIAARKAWEVAQAQAVQRRAWANPEFELEFEELPEISSLGKFGERNIGVSQSIALPMEWWWRREAAKQYADAVEKSVYETKKLDIRLRCQIAYDHILMQRQRLVYLEENHQLAQDFLKKARLRYEAGDVPQLEVLRAEVESGRAIKAVLAARNEWLSAKAELSALLARESGASFEVAGDLAFNPVEWNATDLKELAKQQRADLRGTDLKIASISTQQAAVKASLIPDLNVGVFRQTIDGASNRQGFWRVNIGVEIPLGVLFGERGEIGEIKAEVDRIEAERLALLHQVLVETEQAYMSLQTASEQVQLFQGQIVREAEQAYAVAKRSYTEGKATYLELLETQKTLTEIRVEYAESLFDYRLALAALQRAVGGSLPQ